MGCLSKDKGMGYRVGLIAFGQGCGLKVSKLARNRIGRFALGCGARLVEWVGGVNVVEGQSA